MMTPAEFVDGLAAQAPAVDQLAAAGWSPEEAEEYRSEYTLKPRPRPKARSTDNALLALLAGWQIESVEFGALVFAKEPLVHGADLRV